MPVGVIVRDAPSGELRYANPEAAHLMGRAIAKTPAWLRRDDPAMADENGLARPAEEFPLFRAIRFGERTGAETHNFYRPDGITAILEQTAGPVRDEDGRIVQGILTFHDITSQVKAEEALRQSQRMESIGQLTGGVAHDFNNLLTAILGSLHLVQRRVTDERALQLIDNAMQAGRRGARLTEQLLAFSRRQRLEPRAVDINGLIERMGGLFASTLGGTVQVRTELKPGLPAASADPAQLELALLNLALNARDAMPGGGSLTLSTDVVTIIRPRTNFDPGPGRYVCIRVADTGCGMSEDIQARVFEPFFTSKAEGKGSGLGLSQVLGLAKQLGGGVSIESAPGEGCAVSICVPVSHDAVREPPPVSLAAQQAALAGTSILLVDDDDDVRRFVADLLTESGCSVRTESSGHAGLNALDEGAYDLIVLDFAMPGMTGAEVARLARERNHSAPILIMTGYLEHEAVLAQLGAQPILQKPFEPSELLSRISDTLRRPPGG